MMKLYYEIFIPFCAGAAFALKCECRRSPGEFIGLGGAVGPLPPGGGGGAAGFHLVTEEDGE